MQINTYVLTVLFVLCYNLSDGQGTWTQKANLPGLGKNCPAGFSIGTKAYIGTGQELFTGLTNDFWEYDSELDTWTQKANVPGPKRWAACGFSIGNKGYCGLGISNDSIYACLNDFYEYDPNTDTWTQLADFPGGTRALPVTFTIGQKGYVATGLMSFTYPMPYAADLWEYDPATNLWTQKADFPGGARQGCVGFSIDKQGYIGGGFLQGGSVLKGDFWEWNQVTNIWTQKADFGGGLICEATSFSLCSKGYVCTGEIINGAFTNELWQYSPATDTWVQKSDFGGSARDEAIGLTMDNKAYVGFGADTNGFPIDFWEYTPDSSCSGFINETYNDNVFSIVPNPFSFFTSIRTNEAFNEATLVLFNSYGQQVKKIGYISGQSIKLYRDNLPIGLYFLRLIQDNKVVGTEKLIITE